MLLRRRDPPVGELVFAVKLSYRDLAAGWFDTRASLFAVGFIRDLRWPVVACRRDLYKRRTAATPRGCRVAHESFSGEIGV